MDFDFSFLDNEDFGLAKSFSTAPILSIAPHVNFQQKEKTDIEHELSTASSEAFITEGFCFKFAPGQNVRGLTKYLIVLGWCLHVIAQDQGAKAD